MNRREWVSAWAEWHIYWARRCAERDRVLVLFERGLATRTALRLAMEAAL